MKNVLAGTVFGLAFASLTLCAGLQPIIAPVDGLPKKAHRYMSAVPVSGGWIAATVDGLVLQTRDGWILTRPPTTGEIRVVEPIASGIVVAGAGYAFLYSEQKWRPLDVNDDFTYGQSDGNEAVLVGQSGIYTIHPDGLPQKIAENTARANSISLALDGNILIFSADAPARIWVKGELRPAGKIYNFGDYAQVITAQSLGGGRYFFASSKGMQEVTSTGTYEIGDANRRLLFSEGLIGAFEFDDQVLVGTYLGGVKLISKSTGGAIWSKSVADIGNLCFMREYNGGVLAGTSSGLYVIPNPARYVTAELPKGDVLFSTVLDGRIIAALTSGTYDVKTGTLLFDGLISSILRLSDGRVVRGGIGELRIQEQALHVGGKDIFGLAELNGGSLAILQSEALTFYNPVSGLKSGEVSMPSPTNSLAVYRTEERIYIGTSDGVYVMDYSGKVTSHWGKGRIRVKQIDSEVLALDNTGGLYRRDGQQIISLESVQLVDIAKDRDGVLAIARDPGGLSWIGRIDIPAKRWRPLNVPLEGTVDSLTAFEDGIFAVGSDGNVLSKQPELLQPSPIVAQIAEVDHLAGGGLDRRNSVKESSIDVLLPAPRLGCWPNPIYSFRLSVDEDWRPTIGATRITVGNLTWGNNMVYLRSSWGGYSVNDHVSFVRSWPIWLNPAIIAVYFVIGCGSIWGAVRLRTKALTKRAERLESVINERTSELRAAQSAREEFFSTISHEIRNPLNGVVGLCEMLHANARTDLAPQHRETVTILKECADQLRGLLDDVLDFTRIDRGAIQLNHEIFDFRLAVEGAARSIDPKLQSCALEGPPPGVWVYTDKGKVKQIISNLVSNALKYGMPSYAHIRFKLEPVSADQAIAVINVENRGLSIPLDEQHRIFEGFVRTKDALERRIPGTGLGLAVSRRIARALGGDLTLRSEKGWTEFSAKLVVAPAQAPRTSQDETLAHPIAARALAIEDEKYNRMVLAFYLSDLGYCVDWASTGAQALQFIRSSAYDLILTDIMLPDTTGDLLAEQLLALSPNPKPPVIAVTAYSTPDKISRATAAGISAFVTKPISREKLAAAILGSRSAGAVSRLFDTQLDVGYDFAAFLRMPDGAKTLSEYADEVVQGWHHIVSSAEDSAISGSSLQKKAHTYKSCVLASHAVDVAEQLALLEDAFVEGRQRDAARLMMVIGPMAEELAKAARLKARTITSS